MCRYRLSPEMMNLIGLIITRIESRPRYSRDEMPVYCHGNDIARSCSGHVRNDKEVDYNVAMEFH